MDLIWIGLCLFSFVLSTVTITGYLFFLRPAASARQAAPREETPRQKLQHREHVRGAFVDFFRSVGDRFPGSRKEENPYRKRLQMAGYRSQTAISVFYGIKCGSTFLFGGLFGIIAVFAGDFFNIPLVPMFCGAGLGFLLPDRILDARARSRVVRLRMGLPAALDLMILGIESGQSLDYTIADASRALRLTHPDLSTELTQLHLELRAGHSRTEAFRNFAERNREPEIRKLCTVFIDADRFGTTLGPALRTHAKYLRTRFRQQSQEAARKVGVKLIFPVFFLIFPSVLLVTLGPACMMMYDQLRSLLQ
jgi:tight adherence protein C